MNRIYKLLFIALLAIGNVYAQEPSFTATLSESSVAVGDQFDISFSLNTNGRNFQAPAFTDFQVLSGPNQSTSMQFINGQMAQSVVLSFTLLAKKEGTFKLGPAQVDAAGKRIQSNVVTIKVGKAGAQGKGGAAGSNPDATAQIGKNLMLRVSVNKSSAYQGEAIIATYKLYTKVSVLQYSIENPTINGFWSQDIEMPKQPTLHKEVLDGVQYDVAEIKKLILFPQQNGNLELGRMKGECLVRIQAKRKQRSNDPFEAFFNDPFFGGGVQDVNVKIQSEPVKINVKALPGSPDGFGGAVGDFKMDAFIDKPQGKTNDPITLKIKVTGKGNIKLIDAPKPVLPPDIESYDPKTSDAVTANASTGLSGTRTFEYLLIPRHKGEYKIDPIKFSYFDIDKKQFVTQTSNEFKLKIAQGSESENSSASVVNGVNKEDVQLLGKDIRYIKTGDISLKPAGSIFFGSGLYYTLLIFPVLMFIAFIVYFQKNKELSSNVVLMKSRKATKLAQKRLELAKKHLDTGNKEHFYDEIFKALWGYVSDRLHIPVSQLTKEKADEELGKHNVNEALRNQFVNTINQCEFARFAPGGSAEMQHIYDNTISLITDIEESIK